MVNTNKISVKRQEGRQKKEEDRSRGEKGRGREKYYHQNKNSI
jgi:hypothetical protein